MKKPASLAEAAAIAQFRFALIAPVIHELYPDASRTAYYERITEKPLTLPDGSTTRYSPNTISGWVSKYQRGGIDALMPTERSDKVERHFRTLKERWLYALDLDAISSLAQFNALLLDYMRTYNTTFHSGIDSTPFERYRASCGQVRRPVSSQWLDECFFNRIQRKVNKDSTVSIDKVSYDVPMQFISMKVEIRFLPDDMSTAYIFYEGVHYPIRRTDRNENCRTKRNNPPYIDYSKLGDDHE